MLITKNNLSEEREKTFIEEKESTDPFTEILPKKSFNITYEKKIEDMKLEKIISLDSLTSAQQVNSINESHSFNNKFSGVYEKPKFESLFSAYSASYKISISKKIYITEVRTLGLSKMSYFGCIQAARVFGQPSIKIKDKDYFMESSSEVISYSYDKTMCPNSSYPFSGTARMSEITFSNIGYVTSDKIQFSLGTEFSWNSYQGVALSKGGINFNNPVGVKLIVKYVEENEEKYFVNGLERNGSEVKIQLDRMYFKDLLNFELSIDFFKRKHTVYFSTFLEHLESIDESFITEISFYVERFSSINIVSKKWEETIEVSKLILRLFDN